MVFVLVMGTKDYQIISPAKGQDNRRPCVIHEEIPSGFCLMWERNHVCRLRKEKLLEICKTRTQISVTQWLAEMTAVRYLSLNAKRIDYKSISWREIEFIYCMSHPMERLRLSNLLSWSGLEEPKNTATFWPTIFAYITA